MSVSNGKARLSGARGTHQQITGASVHSASQKNIHPFDAARYRLADEIAVLLFQYNSRENPDPAGLDNVIVRATQKTTAANFADAQMTTLRAVDRLVATQSDYPMANALQLPIISRIGGREIIQ